MRKDSISVKLKTGILALAALFILFGITTYALLTLSVTVDDHSFQTGTVEINLNDGFPVIDAAEFSLEPGMTVEKSFFVENNSTCDVYYKLYLDNITGKLANILEITVTDEDAVLYTGKAGELTRSKVSSVAEILQIGHRKDLVISFYYPKASGNIGQNQYIDFDLCADAVQTLNNPNRLFE